MGNPGGDDLSDESTRQKWNRIHGAATDAGRPAWCLDTYRHLLPARGRALDLACGRGANAMLLAAHGLDTHAWDISERALAAVCGLAAGRGLPVTTLCRDVEAEPPTPDSFDVIVVSRFLHRPSAPALIAALREHGLLFYETFTRDRVGDGGPSNPDYLLEPGELLRLFAGLQPLVYRDEGRVGDLSAGWRDSACLVAQRRR